MSVGLWACLGVVRVGYDQRLFNYPPPQKKKSVVAKTYKVRDYVVVKYEGYELGQGK